jgi:hypothetical protein
VAAKNCKRIPANGEPYCWQHARDWRHRWNALSTNESIGFVLTCAAFVIAAIGLPDVLMSPPWRKPASLVTPTPIPEPAYTVTWDMAVVAGDHRTTFGEIWVRAAKGLFPVNVATFFTIVSPRTVNRWRRGIRQGQLSFFCSRSLSERNLLNFVG